MLLIDICQLLIILDGNTKRRLRRRLMGKVTFGVKSASPLTDVSGGDEKFQMKVRDVSV